MATANSLTGWIAYYAVHQDTQTAVRVAQPLIAVIARHQSEVANFIEQLTTQEDRARLNGAFWAVWQHAADATARIAQDGRRPLDDSLLRALFLNAHWNETIWAWRPLEGNYDRLVQLFDALPLTPGLLTAFTWFLYKLGGPALPYALVNVERKIADIPGIWPSHALKAF